MQLLGRGSWIPVFHVLNPSLATSMLNRGAKVLMAGGFRKRCSLIFHSHLGNVSCFQVTLSTFPWKMPPCAQQPRDVQAVWRKIGSDRCCQIKKAHSLDEPLLILDKYPSRYLIKPLSINLFYFFPVFLHLSFSLSICKFFWKSRSQFQKMLIPIFLPVLDEWLGRIRLYEGPISHRQACFPALRMHLVLTELSLLQLFWYPPPQYHMVALHAGSHMLKKALNRKFMLAVRALPEVGLTFTSTSLLLFKFTAHFPRRPLRNTRIFLYLLD